MMIRLAQESDFLQISQLYVENWRETYQGLLPQHYLDDLSVAAKTEEWHAYCQMAGQGIFVAVDEGNQILGFAAWKPYHRVDDCIYLDSLHVRKAYRGQGIGTTLVKEVCRQGVDEHYGKMGVCVVKGNDEARELYVRLGAEHLRDKVDDFTGETTYSEILLWEI